MFKVIHILFLLTTLFFISCEKENEIKGFKKYDVNEKIVDNIIFKNLNKNKEFDFGNRYLKINKNQKRSNNLEINTELGGIKNLYNEFNSESYFYTDLEDKTTDTIIVLINNFDGYSGNGILLKIFQNQFKAEYSEQSDVIITNKSKDSISIFQSDLTLNDSNFKINDSIFGFLKLKMEKNKELIDAKGFFRTKISKRNF